MSLQIWLPLNGNLNNQGLIDFNPTINTTPTWTNNGKIGKAMMAGSITMPANITKQILNNQQFSFTCWIYVAATTGSTSDRAMLFGNDAMGANNNRKFSIFQYPTCNDLHLSWQNDTANATFTGGTWSGVFPSNRWTHLAITYNNPSGKIYINGIYYASFSGVSNSSSFEYNTMLFANCPNNGRYLNDYRIYNHCLSDKEVEEISKGLVLHYKLDQPANINYNLYTGSKNFTGTWVNGTAWTTDDDTYNGFTVKRKSSVWGGLAQNITATNGDIFTISFWGKVDIGGNILSIHRSSLGNVTTGLTILDGNFSSSTNWINTGEDGTQWKRYWATLRINSTDITYLQWRIENSVADKNLYVAGMTLEKGYGTKNWSLSASEGGISNIIYDSSGYKNNGEAINTPSIVFDTARFNSCLHISATNQKIHISNFLTSGFGNSYSFAWWGKRNSNSPMFWGFSDGIRLNGMYIGNLWNTGDSSNNPLYNIGTTTQVTAPSVNIWHHYVMTGNGTKCYVYLDGELWAEAKTYKAISGTSIYINGWDSGTSYCSDNMSISDFRIYATALTADQIKKLYNTSASIDNKGNIYTRELIEL